MRFALVTAGVLALSLPLPAQTVEQFVGLSPGSLTGQGSGSGWQSNAPLPGLMPWQSLAGPGLQVQTLGQTFAGLKTAGGSVKIGGPSAGAYQAASRNAAADLTGTTGTQYASFLITKTAAAQGDYGGVRIGDLFVGDLSGGQQWGIGRNGSPTGAFSKTSTVLNQTTLLVVAITKGADGGRVDLYVNPTPGGPKPAAADATLTNFVVNGCLLDPVTGLDDHTRTKVVLLAGQEATACGCGGSAAFTVSDLRFSNNYLDVVPVPEPAGLLAVGLGVLAVRRFRR